MLISSMLETYETLESYGTKVAWRAPSPLSNIKSSFQYTLGSGILKVTKITLLEYGISQCI